MDEVVILSEEAKYLTTQEVVLKTPGGESFDSLVMMRQMLRDTMGSCKEQMEVIDKKLGYAMDGAGIGGVISKDGWLISRTGARKAQRKIDPHKLLQLGVTAATINAATIVGVPGKAGIRMSRPGEKSEVN